MGVIICSTTYGGCGHVSKSTEWKWADRTHDYLMCPYCGEDHAFGLSRENLDSFTNEYNYDRAKEMLNARQAPQVPTMR